MKHCFTFDYCKTKFYGSFWEAQTNQAVVVLVHGMGEHLGRYKDSVIPVLIENGYHVVAFDHFGHGKTEGKRGHNPGFEYVLESVSKVIKKANTLFPNLPIFLYGHSMGGNTVINYALKRQVDDICGIIVTSPMLQLSMKAPKWKIKLGKIIQKIRPSLTLSSGLNPHYISRIPKEVEYYENDPLCHDKISPNYSITFIETGKWAIQNASTLKKPMLLLHGTGDLICDFKGSVAFAKNNKNVTLKLYENAYHELHHDKCKKEMLNDVISWLNTHF